MKKQETTTVRIYKNRIPSLNILSQRAGKSQVDYVSQMVYFIKKTGLDIYTEGEKNVPDLIQNLDRRIVSFLKQREKDFFVPMDRAFKEQIKIFKEVLLGLENFDLINLTQKSSEKVLKNDEKKLIIPVEEKTEKIAQISDEEIPKNKAEIIEKKELDFIELEELKSQNKIYKETINYLLKNIKPGSALSGAKFVINVTQKDIDRIKKLVV